MATFTPQVNPTQDPNYLSYSKVIDAPPPDKTKGVALASIGEDLDAGANIADHYVKKSIDDQVHKGVETNRDAYTTALENVSTQLKSGTIPNGSPKDSLLSDGSDDPDKVPASLEDSLAKVDALGQVKIAGGNKINDTYYTANLNAAAKNLRNQYPGYKDYIDQKFAEISGVNPANAYYKNLMEDINKDAGRNKSETDRLIGHLYQHIEIPGIAEVIQGVRAGVVNEYSASKFLNQNLQSKFKHDQWQRDREEVKGTREEASLTATDQFNQEASSTAFNRFNTVITLTGLDNPNTVSKLIQDQQENRIHLSDDQNQQLLSALVSQRRSVAAELKNVADQRGYTSRIGDPKKVDDYINSNLKIYDDAIDAIKNKDYGTAFGNMRRAEALQNDESVKLLSDPSVGAFTRLTASMTKFAGPNWVSTQMGTGLVNGMATKYAEYVKDITMKSQLPDDLRKDGVVKSLYADIADAQKKGIPVSSKVYDNLIDNINTLRNPKAPENVKLEVAQYAFNPNNLRIMNQFKMDYTDPDTGKTVPGKYSVFSRLTSEDMTNSIWDLGKKDKSVWTNYKDWGEQSFKTLFGEEIKNLNGFQEDKSVPIRVNWDADNRRFSITSPDGSTLRNTDHTVVTDNYIKSMTASVNRLNSGLNSLSKIQDKEGSDTSSYLLNTLFTLGFKPGERVAGFPQKIMDAIANSRKSVSKRFEETFGDLPTDTASNGD